MPDGNSRLSIYIRRRVFALADEKTLPHFFIFFVLVTILFGIIYSFLTPLGHGLGMNSVPLECLSILRGIYFSIVTVSSLGYGDLHPVGLSRALASIQVLLGLFVVGIMIVKLTSGRVSHLVSRLFVSESRKQLNDFGLAYKRISMDLSELLPKLSRAYQPTPGNGDMHIDKKELSESFRHTVVELQSRSQNLRDYVREESMAVNYFELVPPLSVVDLSDSVHDAIDALSQCIISLPVSPKPEHFGDVLGPDIRAMILEAVEMQNELWRVGLRHASDEDVLVSLRRLRDKCEGVPVDRLQTPREEQPDQTVRHSDEPQNSMELDEVPTDTPRHE